MRAAVEAVANDIIGYKKFSMFYNLLLVRHVKKKLENTDYTLYQTMDRFRYVFISEQKAKPIDYLTENVSSTI